LLNQEVPNDDVIGKDIFRSVGPKRREISANYLMLPSNQFDFEPKGASIE
jgi:hypothetical protein